jgi:hypothetical protein
LSTALVFRASAPAWVVLAATWQAAHDDDDDDDDDDAMLNGKGRSAKRALA